MRHTIVLIKLPKPLTTNIFFAVFSHVNMVKRIG